MKEYIAHLEARAIILDSVGETGPERVPLPEALGRTLAEPVVSDSDIPPFDNSAMDGFAARAEDLQDGHATLRLAGEVAAGDARRIDVRPGTCVRIMTGAPLPAGADVVVPVEKTNARDGEVEFLVCPEAGAYVRRAGGDLRQDEEVMAPGHRVGPPEIGVMAALGYAQVTVARRPTVAVLSTGNELVDVSETPGPGQIRDSNGPALESQIRTAGGVVFESLRARDDRSEIRRCLERTLEADVVVISGGVSVGEYDYVKDELDALGMDLLFWKVRQKPGKPLAFGRISGTPIFGLPGNPVSSTVCFQQYVRPALRKMLGRSRILNDLERGILSAPVTKNAGLHYFARGTARGTDAGLQVEPAPHQGSHVGSSLVKANGFIHLPEDLDEAPAGLRVEFEWFDW